MSVRRNDLSRLLRWYPPQWRERYGDELEALVADTLEEEKPSLRFVMAVSWAGLG